MNDRSRELWLDNDEGLYNWWRRSRLGKRKFVQANRAEIDKVVNNVLSGAKPAHYLAYDQRASVNERLF